MKSSTLKSVRSIVLCLVVSMALAACTSTGTTKFAMEKSHAIPRDATASLNIRSAVSGSQEYRVEIERLLNEKLSAGLVAANIFETVTGPSNIADYQIDVRIDQIRIVHPAARAMLAAMAGRSFVTVHVDVRQAKSDRLITSFDTTGSGASVLVGDQSYGYDDPVREAVAQIIQNLR